jgi:hypothetical protein
MTTTYHPGAIFHMLAGGGVQYEDGTVRNGPPDTIEVPEELGGGEREIVTARVLRTCPQCGDEASKPAFVLTGDLILSECRACERFLWLQSS